MCPLGFQSHYDNQERGGVAQQPGTLMKRLPNFIQKKKLGWTSGNEIHLYWDSFMEHTEKFFTKPKDRMFHIFKMSIEYIRIYFSILIIKFD